MGHLPIKALGMVILSHILSRISSPDSGRAITLAIVAMSVLMFKLSSSNASGNERGTTKDKRLVNDS